MLFNFKSNFIDLITESDTLLENWELNMLKKLFQISLLLLSLTLSLSSYSQSVEILPKPNYFPKAIKKISDVSSSVSYIDKKELNKIGVEEKQIEKLNQYYLNKTKDFFKDKRENGFITLLVEVTAVIPKNKNIECSNEPTQCSLTQINFIFSDNISKEQQQKYLDTITEQTKKDNIEIFIKNFSYEDKLKFAFTLYLDNETKDKFSVNNEVIMKNFLLETNNPIIDKAIKKGKKYKI